MLTNIEKRILGYMVDMGNLRGQQRIDASSDDELARNLIGSFSAQMQVILPKQINNLETQKLRLDEEFVLAQDLLNLLGNFLDNKKPESILTI